MTDKIEKKEAGSTGKQASYILKTVGVNLPGYKRSELKIGMVVVLDEKVGDGYSKRGLLKKGLEVKDAKNEEITELKKIKATLEKENGELKSEVKNLAKQLKDTSK